MTEYAAVISRLDNPVPKDISGFTHWRLEDGFLLFMWHTQDTAEKGLAPKKATAMNTANIASFSVVEIKKEP